MLGAVVGLTELFDPNGNFGGLTTPIDKWFREHFGFDPSNIPISIGMPQFGNVLPPSFWRTFGGGQAAEAAHSVAPVPYQPNTPWPTAIGQSSVGQLQQQVTVSGEAQVQATVRVEAGSELLRIVSDVQRLLAQIPLSGMSVPGSAGTGAMDGAAAPKRGGLATGGSYSP